MGITYREYHEKYRLPEQEADEKRLYQNKHHVLAYEPGKGKSFPVIYVIRKIARERKKLGLDTKLLILSDATCIKDMWKAEILPQGILPQQTYFCTDRTAIGAVKDELVKMKWDIIVCDECQSLRSGVTRSKSQYAKLVYALTRRTEWVFGMTGTIAGNNTVEPWCVLHNLNVGGMGDINCNQFKQRFCNQELGHGPFGNFMKVTGLNNMGEELLNKCYEKYVSFWPWDENDEMPEFKIQDVILPCKPTEDYEKALQGILQCGEHESTVMKAIALQKAQQTLNGFLYYNVEAEREVWRVRDYMNPKLTWLRNHLINLYDKFLTWDNYYIVAYRYQEDFLVIKEMLDDMDIKWTDDISMFKDPLKRCKSPGMVLLLQCSRGKSVNLQFCQQIIYYTSDFSFISFKQMIHRCWRRGQDKPCTVYFLINDPGDKHHVEQKIWISLRKKQNIHDTLMNIKKED